MDGWMDTRKYDTVQPNTAEDNLILWAQRKTQIARPAEKRVHRSWCQPTDRLVHNIQFLLQSSVSFSLDYRADFIYWLLWCYYLSFKQVCPGGLGVWDANYVNTMCIVSVRPETFAKPPLLTHCQSHPSFSRTTLLFPKHYFEKYKGVFLQNSFFPI